MAIITTVILLIWFVVHFFLIQMYLVQDTRANADMHAKNMVTITEYGNHLTWQNYCIENNFICGTDSGDNTQEFNKTFNEFLNVGSNQRNMIMSKSPTYMDRLSTRYFKQIVSFSVPHKEHMLIVFGSRLTTKGTYFAFNFKDVQDRHTKTKVYFYLWMNAALIFWLIGGLSLLLFHKARFSKKAKRTN